MIEIYTDGSCTGGGRFKGVGGWGYALLSNNDRIEMENAEGVLDSTSNRMEIQAVIEAMKQLLGFKHMFDERKVMFYSDSQIVVDCLKKGSTYQQKRNKDMWDEIKKLKTELEKFEFDIDFTWISTKQNKRADRLATKARDGIKNILAKG